MKELKVLGIKNGTVIDHLPAGTGLAVRQLLKLNGQGVCIVAENLFSNKMGKKDMIKIENRELNPEEFNIVALLAPSATITIIKDGDPIKKTKVKIPSKIEGLAICPNPNCITNIENVASRFYIQHRGGEIKMSCYYCEKTYPVDNIHLKT